MLRWVKGYASRFRSGSEAWITFILPCNINFSRDERNTTLRNVSMFQINEWKLSSLHQFNANDSSEYSFLHLVLLKQFCKVGNITFLLLKFLLALFPPQHIYHIHILKSLPKLEKCESFHPISQQAKYASCYR